MNTENEHKHEKPRSCSPLFSHNFLLECISTSKAWGWTFQKKYSVSRVTRNRVPGKSTVSTGSGFERNTHHRDCWALSGIPSFASFKVLKRNGSSSRGLAAVDVLSTELGEPQNGTRTPAPRTEPGTRNGTWHRGRPRSGRPPRPAGGARRGPPTLGGRGAGEGRRTRGTVTCTGPSPC